MGTIRHKQRQGTYRKTAHATARRRKRPATDHENLGADESLHENHHHEIQPNTAGNVGYWAPLWGDDCPPGKRTGGWL